MPPQAQIGPVTPDERQRIVGASLLAGHYEQAIDRESAYEVLKERTAGNSGIGDMLGSIFGGGSSRRQGVGEALVKSAVRTIGSEVGRQIVRGVLVSLLGSKR